MLALTQDTIFDTRYTILRQLGEGGMGSIYLACEIELNREVAIKILHREFIADEDQRARFEREGRILSSLSHPNILKFYRFGLWQKTPYIVMEYLEGNSLHTVIERTGALPPAQCLKIAIQISEALSFTHEHNFIHRDLTPSNVFLEDSNNVKLVDFGLARTIQSETNTQHLTQTGALIGSIYYMSPEQCSGQKADQRSDIYSLACVLYQTLTGNPPFQADNPIGLMHKHTTESPKSLSSQVHTEAIQDRQTLRNLDPIMFKALSKDPSARYQTMAEFKNDLLLLQQGLPSKLPMPPSPGTDLRPLVYGAIALALLAAAGTMVVMQLNVPHSRTIAKTTQESTFGVHSQVDHIRQEKPSRERLRAVTSLAELVESGTHASTDEIETIFLKLEADTRLFGNVISLPDHLTKGIALLSKQGPNSNSKARLLMARSRVWFDLTKFNEAGADAALAYKLLPPDARLQDQVAAVCSYANSRRRLLYLISEGNRAPVETDQAIPEHALVQKLTDLLDKTASGHLPTCYSDVSAELSYFLLLENSPREKRLFSNTMSLLDTQSVPYSLAWLQRWSSAATSAKKDSLILPRVKLCLDHLKKSRPKADIQAAGIFAGQLLLEDHQWAAAEKIVSEVLDADPQFHDTQLEQSWYLTRTTSLLRMKKEKEAKDAINQCCTKLNSAQLQSIALTCAELGNLADLERIAPSLELKGEQKIADGRAIYNFYMRLSELLSPMLSVKYLQSCERILSHRSGDSDFLLASIRSRLASILSEYSGNYVEALRLYRLALPHLQAARNERPKDQDLSITLYKALIQAGTCEIHLGQSAAGQNMITTALHDSDKENLETCTTALLEAFSSYRRLSMIPEAEKCMRDVIQRHRNTNFAINAANTLAVTLHAHGQPEKAGKYLAEEPPLPANWPRTRENLNAYMNSYMLRAAFLFDAGRYLEAEPLYEAAAALSSQGKDLDPVRPLTCLAICARTRHEKPAQVEHWLASARRHITPKTIGSDLHFFSTQELIQYHNTGRTPEMLMLLKQTAKDYESKFDPQAPEFFQLATELYMQLGRSKDAVAAANRRVEAINAVSGWDSPEAGEARKSLKSFEEQQKAILNSHS